MRQGNLFDDFTRLMTDASEVALGVRREAETALKSQLERLFASMDIVSREEFEAVKQMAILAREDNVRLLQRIATLELQMAVKSAPSGTPADAGQASDPSI
jgi:BMFP domain-containing protein YqiC